MDLRKLVTLAERFTVSNSPVLLTTVGVVGTVGTAVLAFRAGEHYARVIDENDEPRLVAGQPPASFKEKVELTWPIFIPPASSAALTITAVILANRVGGRRAAAMAAAYATSERAFEAYREKVMEKVGSNKERQVRESVVADQVRNDPTITQIIVPDDSRQLCMEMHSGRTFLSTMEDIKHAQNKVNHKIIREDSASLNDYYDALGLDRTDAGEHVGWNTSNIIEIDYGAALDSKNRPVLTISFLHRPKEKYWKVFA